MRDLKTENLKPQNSDLRSDNSQLSKSVNKVCKKSKKNQHSWGWEYTRNRDWKAQKGFIPAIGVNGSEPKEQKKKKNKD